MAQLTREFPPEVYGGAGVHVDGLTSALSRKVDVQVHCMGAHRDDPRVAAAYGTWDALHGAAPHLAALRHLATDLAMVAGVDAVDLVHSHTWYTSLAGELARLTYRIPHVMTCHSLEPLRPWKEEQLAGGYALSCFAERTAIEQADAVIAVSSAMRSDILECYPSVEPERVHVIHNGIDPRRWRPDPDVDVCRRIGMDPARPSVVFVGRITRQKGLSHLLDAVAHLDGDAQVVLLAGQPDTPQIAAEARERILQLRSAGVAVVWASELMLPMEVAQILTHATVLACPSIYEPFGLVNLEAMACGTPVVASAVGGIPEVVGDTETGYLVPVEHGNHLFAGPVDEHAFALAFASRLNALLDDPGEAARMGRAGRQRVEADFTWALAADRTAALYERLLRT